MKKATLAASLLLSWAVGCGEEPADLLDTAQTSDALVQRCGSDPQTIDVNEENQLTVISTRIKKGRRYNVEVTVGESTETIAKVTGEAGRLSVHFTPNAAGEGMLRVLTLRGRRRARCTFDVNSSEGSGGSGGVCLGPESDLAPTPGAAPWCEICPTIDHYDNSKGFWNQGGKCLEITEKELIGPINGPFKVLPNTPECYAAKSEYAADCCTRAGQPNAVDVVLGETGVNLDDTETYAANIQNLADYKSRHIVGLCTDETKEESCYPVHPTALVVRNLPTPSTPAGPLGEFANEANRQSGPFRNDGATDGEYGWTCRRAYYLIKNGHLPLNAALDLIGSWRGPCCQN